MVIVRLCVVLYRQINRVRQHREPLRLYANLGEQVTLAVRKGDHMVGPEQRGVNEVVAGRTARVCAPRQAPKQTPWRCQQVFVAQRRLKGPLAVMHQIAVVQQPVNRQHRGNAKPPRRHHRLEAKQAPQVVQVNKRGPLGDQ